MKRHPAGLRVLFCAEAFERYSFYAMRALLPFYLTERLGFSSGRAADIIGTYLLFVYALPMVGGWLADRYLGFFRAVVLGGFVMALGHAAMTVESVPALYLAMGLIAIGNGFFKPSMQCLVRGLYPAGDPRIDSAFSIFYVGINIGATLAVVGAALLRKHFGWHVAFGSAGVGLLLGLVQLWFLRQHVTHAAHGSSLAAVTHVDIADPTFQDRPQREDRRRIWAILGLSAIAAVFWMAFYQDSATLPLWARDNVDRRGVSPEWFSAINPIMVIIGTPPVVWLCSRLRLSTTTRVLVGMLFASGAFGLLSFAARSPGLAHWGWLVGGYVTLTVGELLVSPGGNALVGKLAPPRYLGILTGVWLLSSAVGGKLAGRLGALWDAWPHAQFFGVVAGAALVTAGAVFLTRGALQDIIDRATAPETIALPVQPAAPALCPVPVKEIAP